MGAFDKYHVSSARNACISQQLATTAPRQQKTLSVVARLPSRPLCHADLNDASPWHTAARSLASRSIPRLACPLPSNKQTQTLSVGIPERQTKGTLYVAAMLDCTQHSVMACGLNTTCTDRCRLARQARGCSLLARVVWPSRTRSAPLGGAGFTQRAPLRLRVCTCMQQPQERWRGSVWSVDTLCSAPTHTNARGLWRAGITLVAPLSCIIDTISLRSVHSGWRWPYPAARRRHNGLFISEHYRLSSHTDMLPLQIAG
jgi:hypothetical protein